jgi:hypothetical protein
VIKTNNIKNKLFFLYRFEHHQNKYFYIIYLRGHQKFLGRKFGTEGAGPKIWTPVVREARLKKSVVSCGAATICRDAFSHAHAACAPLKKFEALSPRSHMRSRVLPLFLSSRSLWFLFSRWSVSLVLFAARFLHCARSRPASSTTPHRHATAPRRPAMLLQDGDGSKARRQRLQRPGASSSTSSAARGVDGVEEATARLHL